MTVSKRIISAVSFGICAVLVLFSEQAMAAAKLGLDIWWNNVLPALFPFFVCASLIQTTGALNGNSKLFLKLAALLHLPQSVLPVFIVSAVSGTPTAARLCGNLKENGALNDSYAQLMAALFNFCSPLFITGTICISMFNEPRLAIPVLAGHYISSVILFAIFFPVYYKQSTNKWAGKRSMEQKAFYPWKALTSSISEGMEGMLKVGGTIVLFMVLIAMFEYTGILDAFSYPFEIIFKTLGLNPDAVKPLLTGIIELTNGCYKVAAAGLTMREGAAACAFLLSFGGLCILAQSMSFMEIKVIKYLGFKTLNGIAACIITYFLVPNTIYDSTAVFYQPQLYEWQNNTTVCAVLFVGAFIGITASIFFSAALKHRIKETRLNHAAINTNGRHKNGRVPLR